MPIKIRNLIKQLRAAGFTLTKNGKGSHRRFKKNGVTATICGHDGDDAKPYMEAHVRDVIEEANKRGER